MGNSQYFSLMLVKLVRWRPAKLGKVFPAEKHIHSGQTQMCESLAVIDKVVNTLSTELLVSNAKKEKEKTSFHQGPITHINRQIRTI